MEKNQDPNEKQKVIPRGREEAERKGLNLSNMVNSTSSYNEKQKPILVLINPHSGRGKSVSIYKKKLMPYLKSHNIDHHVFITEAESRVQDYIHAMSLAELANHRSIVVVSGDGLFHETVNALMSRPDWEKASSVPIGLVPTGSGNGLAYTLIRQRHQDSMSVDEAIRVCCEQAIRNDISEADLVKITFGPQTVIWSFLSLGWGLLADIDIDSEWLRPLGELRFTIYGLLRSVTSVLYRGRLSYKPAINSIDQNSGNDNKFVLESNISSRMYNQAPAYRDEQQDDENDNWVHIEDKFTCLYAVYQSHISSVSNFAPKSTLTDQLMYLTYIRGKLTVCRVIEFLLAIKDGSHDKLSYVNVVPVTRFKFQPLDSSKIVIDGEQIQWNLTDGPIEAKIVPRVLKLSWTPQHE